MGWTQQKASQSSPSLPLESENIQTSLVGLAELYNYVEEFINSPSTQQSLLSSSHEKLMEQALEGSITLLDTCNMARDVLLTMKEQVQTLQSALRRKGGDSSVESNIQAYLCFRKKAKDIAKCLGGLKRMETNVTSSSHDQDLSITMVDKILRETSSITISIFRSLLKFVSMPATSTKSKSSGWSLISKLVRMRTLSYFEKEQQQKIVNLVGNVDACLHSLLGNNKAMKGELKCK